MMDIKEKKAWLRLIRTPNIGPLTFYQLLRRYKTAENALYRLRESALTLPSETCIEEEWAWCEARNIHILAREEEGYPHLLKQIEDAPPLIFVEGHLHALSQAVIALVGARNASLQAMNWLEQHVPALNEYGLNIVSGLARGIDTKAHMLSVKEQTIAVMGCGLAETYPKENERLRKNICEYGGCIVSELKYDTKPQAQHFPKRNRIISGLSRAVIVVEAALKSGSLITARYATEQGREVYAVPGFPLDARSKGTNYLIKQGASLVETAEDIIENLSRLNLYTTKKITDSYFLEDLPQEYGNSMVDKADKIDKIDNSKVDLLSILSGHAMDINDIARLAKLPIDDVEGKLLDYELNGLIVRMPGRKVARLYG